MNKKGFTLIELLAVIVILAIIALIATPIVLNIIKDSKENAQLRSAEMYLNAVEQSVSIEKMNNTNFKPNSCEIEKGNLNCEGYDKNPIKVEVNGEVPEEGTITFENGRIKDVTLTYSNGKTVVKNNESNLVYKTSACTLIDKDGDNVASLSDEIECAGEYFHVMENDGKTISMLSKYNLDVGNYNTSSSTISIAAIQNPTGIQNEKARGAILNAAGTDADYANIYGTIVFSTSNYWYSSGLKAEYGTSYPAWVYTDKDGNVDEANNIYTHVENYEEYLKGKGVKSASATLISYEQLEKLGCDPDTNACAGTVMGEAKGGTAPSWVYYTSYWSGSANNYNDVWTVDSVGFFGNYDFDSDSYFGVRPVVNISVSEI